MPVGLDGNPDPVRSPERDAVVSAVADEVLRRRRERPVLVGVDGEAGSGKSTFADELARELEARDVVVVRSSIDSFHRPRRERFPPAVDLQRSYVDSSHDLDTLRRSLLDPFRNGSGHYSTAAFDEPSDTPIAPDPRPIAADLVLVFDGLFVHRPELALYWDLSVLLEDGGRARASAREGLRRMTADLPWPEVLAALAQWSAFAHRYIHGWQLYVDRCQPRESATIVIDNRDLLVPHVVSNTT